MLRILVTVKQVPQVESLAFEPSGSLRREGVKLEMSSYCRRAVAKGVQLARQTSGWCTVASLGPPSAEEVLRESLAWGADDAILLSDPAFVGSDTLATARALAALAEMEGPFDLVLVGVASLDAETGQVGPELAELMDLPFAAAVRELVLDEADKVVRLRCEQDDGWRVSVVRLPAVLAVAERLCSPAKLSREVWSAIPLSKVRMLRASDLASSGPWGADGSPTKVGSVRTLAIPRRTRGRAENVGAQVRAAVDLLRTLGALDVGDKSSDRSIACHVSEPVGKTPISVLVEPDRDNLARELLGCAVSLAAGIGGRVVAVVVQHSDVHKLWSWGADEIVRLIGVRSEEDVAAGASAWALAHQPAVVLAPGTYWGREVASRLAVRLGAGLTGDALELEMKGGRLVAWKPACGGSRLAAITATSPVQMATVRPGVLPLLRPRQGETTLMLTEIPVLARDRVLVEDAWRDDDLETLARARVVVGVGAGVAPDGYGELSRLAALLDGELAGTRKVTDQGWLPRSRQIGLTGRSISPELYVAVGISGNFNHMIGVRGAGTILAINSDPDAPILVGCDMGIVGDWRTVVPLLVGQLES